MERTKRPLDDRKYSCEYRHFNKVKKCIVCTSENVAGIYKSEAQCMNCLSCTGKMWRGFTRHERS